MPRKAQRIDERRKLVLAWMDTASKMSKGNTLFIPMNHGVERTTYLQLCQDFLQEHKTLFPTSSVYTDLKAYSTHKGKVPYIAVTKMSREKVTDKAYIVSKNEKEKVLRVLFQSTHTRKRQIVLLLAEGYSPEEIRKALGKTISPDEEKILVETENNLKKSENFND